MGPDHQNKQGRDEGQEQHQQAVAKRKFTVWEHASQPVGIGRCKEYAMVAVHSPGTKTAMTCLQCRWDFRQLTMRIFLSVSRAHDRRMTASSRLPL